MNSKRLFLSILVLSINSSQAMTSRATSLRPAMRNLYQRAYSTPAASEQLRNAENSLQKALIDYYQASKSAGTEQTANNLSGLWAKARIVAEGSEAQAALKQRYGSVITPQSGQLIAENALKNQSQVPQLKLANLSRAEDTLRNAFRVNLAQDTLSGTTSSETNQLSNLLNKLQTAQNTIKADVLAEQSKTLLERSKKMADRLSLKQAEELLQEAFKKPSDLEYFRDTETTLWKAYKAAESRGAISGDTTEASKFWKLYSKADKALIGKKLEAQNTPGSNLSLAQAEELLQNAFKDPSNLEHLRDTEKTLYNAYKAAEGRGVISGDTTEASKFWKLYSKADKALIGKKLEAQNTPGSNLSLAQAEELLQNAFKDPSNLEYLRDTEKTLYNAYKAAEGRGAISGDTAEIMKFWKLYSRADNAVSGKELEAKNAPGSKISLPQAKELLQSAFQNPSELKNLHATKDTLYDAYITAKGRAQISGDDTEYMKFFSLYSKADKAVNNK